MLGGGGVRGLNGNGKNIIKIIFKYVNQLYILSVRLLVSSRILLVKLWGYKSYKWIFHCMRGQFLVAQESTVMSTSGGYEFSVCVELGKFVWNLHKL